MWTDTPATRRLGIAYPIIQGPFGGGASSVALTATVSSLGGLGSFGAQHLPPDRIVAVIGQIRARTSRPFAVNLWVDNADAAMSTFGADAFARHVDRLKPTYAALGLAVPERPDQFGQSFDDQVAALLAAAPPAFSFVFGIPAPAILDACRDRGIVTIGNATTVDEAQAIEAAGVDMVVATGAEAGGHRVSFRHPPERVLTGTLALVPQVRDAVRIPVIAAGGIMDGRGVAATLTLGADAAQLGTAFLACAESGASAVHRAALFADMARQTMLTRAFSGRLARTIRSAFAEAYHIDDVAPYPAQNWLTASFRAAAIAHGRSDLIPLYAGQAAALLHHRRAGDLFAALIADTDAALDRARGATPAS